MVKEERTETRVGLLKMVLALMCLLTSVVSCTGDDSGDAARADYSHLLDSVLMLAKTDSVGAMRLIDEAEASGVVSWDTIRLARADVYYVRYDMVKQERELMAIKDSSSSDKSSVFYLDVLERLARLQATMKNTKQAIATSLYGDSIALATDNMLARAHFRFAMGMSAMQNDNERGVKYINESIEILESLNDSASRMDVVRQTMYLMNIYTIQGAYDECIKVGEKMTNDIRANAPVFYDKLDPTKSIRFGIYGLLCLSYANVGRMNEAGVAYAYALTYDNESPTTPVLLANCLMSMKRYEEALVKFNGLAVKYESSGDTVNYEYVNVLEGKMICAKSSGDMRSALSYAKRIIGLRHSIYMNDGKKEYSELETRYRTQENEMRNQDVMAELQAKRVLAVSLAVLILFSLVAILLFLRYSSIMDRKNRVLKSEVEKVMSADMVRRRISKAASAAGDAKDALSEETVLNVETFIRELSDRQLCNDPLFNKDDLLDELNISKRGFGRDFENITGLSVTRYVAMLRMRSATEKIKKFPNHTIESIALDCGFSNRSSFYRQFSDHFGMTPTEYRRQLDVMERDK